MQGQQKIASRAAHHDVVWTTFLQTENDLCIGAGGDGNHIFVGRQDLLRRANQRQVGVRASGNTHRADGDKVADVSDVTKVVTVLATSPELPYGGLLISNNFPKPLADQIVKLFTDNMDQLKDYVESQIYAQYPTVQIQEIAEDYAQKDLKGRNAFTSEIVLDKSDVFPIKTFPSFEVDPLAGITTALTNLAAEEELWIQFIIRPVDDSWHKRSIAYIDEVTKGKPARFGATWEQKLIMLPFQLLQEILHAAFIGPNAPADKKDEKKDADYCGSVATVPNRIKLAKSAT